MNYLKISNSGLMEITSLTLLGASSKGEHSGKIGRFGSGNKYAIAYFLRNGYELCIYSGLERIEISTVDKQHRDNVLSVVCFNGVETSITTDFGKDWELWQAIREIYCNAIDEGGYKMEYVFEIEPIEGMTQFYIRTKPEINNFVSSFDTYFAENKEVLFECEDGRILGKTVGDPSLKLYRRGIKCFDTDKNSIFDYDLKNIDINENRLVKYGWEVPSCIWNLIYQCTNNEVIKQALFQCSDSQYIECIQSDLASLSSHGMSKEYKEVLQELTLAPRGLSGLLNADEFGSVTVLPNILFEQAKPLISNDNLADRFKVYKNGTYIEIAETPLHKAVIDKACYFLNECNYKGVFDYKLQIARFEDKKVLGFANIPEGKIMISEICIDKGVQMVIETMIEEYIHLKYNVMDNTRSFQDAAITEIVNLLKVKNAFVV